MSIEHLYRQVLPGSGQAVEVVARSLLLEPADLVRQLQPLIDLDIVTVDDDVLVVASPRTAVTRFVADHAARLARASSEITRLVDVLPALAEREGGAAEDSTALAGEVSLSGDVPGLLVRWIQETRGDLCFMRPDQWQLPSESEMAVAVGGAVREGRRVRALYPARALREAPEVLSSRAAIGEQIRVVPEVMTRLAIIGGERALVPEPLGRGSTKRLTLRQPSVVAIFQDWFDLTWERASVVPTLDRGEVRPDLRRLLLAQLADGVKDEQIARNLDVSLRTVRRRVAALMTELGVDTRFQAGVEAARRGWL